MDIFPRMTLYSRNMRKTSDGIGSCWRLFPIKSLISILRLYRGPVPRGLWESCQIRTGVDCLRRFRQGFSEITDPEEKVKFTLAAYNAGIGHIYDAQRLARKYGKDPNKWDNNVAEYIRLKNDPEYYNDPVCKHGYLRGSETYNYVREVLERYHYYKKKS